MKWVSCALLVIGLWGLPHWSFGQVRYQAAQFLAVPAHHDKPPRLLTQQTLFPKAVLQNPMNFAPLCRLELKIERQSPVGNLSAGDQSGIGLFEAEGATP
jgi:hypothetical protein